MIITILLLILSLSIGAIYIYRNFSAIREKDMWVESPKFWKGIGIVILGIILSIVQPFYVTRVDAGNVGIKVSLFGNDRGVGKFEYVTGWILINEWSSRFYQFPIYQQTIEYEEQPVITKGGFSATIHPKFNYSIKPGSVGEMFTNLRLGVKDIEQGWLKTAIVGAVNDVANKWPVDDIFNKREEFESAIIIECNKRVAKWFVVSQLRTNIVPPKALQDAINAKTKAIQEVQVAENQKLVAIAEGEKTIAKARADSAAKVITAAGEAEAIKRLQVNLTPSYLDYIKTQRWNGVLPQVQGAGSGLIFQLPK